nr:MAG TPA: hypothetical protein [Bacteriophage sp.]
MLYKIIFNHLLYSTHFYINKKCVIRTFYSTIFTCSLFG